MIDRPAVPARSPVHTLLKRVGATPTRAAHRFELLGIGGAALLLTVLSLPQLGRYSFWRDEVASVVFASAPVQELLTIVGRNREVADVPFMATYALLLHFWLKVAETEAQIRFLSLVAGVATTIPVYFIGRRLGGWQAGTLAALVFAASPYVIEWNQEARSYSLAIFVSAMLTLLLLRALERPTVLRWLTYGLIGAVGLYVHFFVGFVLATHGVYVLITRPWPSPRPLVAAAIPLGLAALPLPSLMSEFGSEYAGMAPLTLENIQSELATLTAGLPLMVAMVALGAVGVGAHRHDRRVWLILAIALVPIVAAITVSLFRPMLQARYLVVTLPAMAILTGAGLAAIRPLAARAAAIGVLGVLLVLALPSAYLDDRHQDWRSAGGWIAASAHPGDAVIVTPWGGRPLNYYLERVDGGTVPERIGIDRALAGEPADRVWVVLTDLYDWEEEAVIDRLSDRFEPGEERDFGAKIRVVLMTSTE